MLTGFFFFEAKPHAGKFCDIKVVSCYDSVFAKAEGVTLFLVWLRRFVSFHLQKSIQAAVLSSWPD